MNTGHMKCAIFISKYLC